ncbi:hypothetical protein KW800_02120 [Candidatus Parcubacteria bacterium]|nr:hypothetical protein [Candidatus Parcubacteria bacterium]
MSIPDSFSFDKSGEVVRFPHIRTYFLTLLFIMVALLAFGIGRLTGGERVGVTINTDSQEIIANDQTPKPKLVQETPLGSGSLGIDNSAQSASVYASSKGTRYYYMSCKSTVSEKNKVTFASAKEAETAGFTLAANCKP